MLTKHQPLVCTSVLSRYAAVHKLSISVSGSSLTRQQQEDWTNVVGQSVLGEPHGSDFPLYELLSTCLLPLSQKEATSTTSTVHQTEPHQTSQGAETRMFHALLTSHHLISTKKRRSLQNWVATLHLSGFAKIGYPGIIYVQGESPAVEQFVTDVKDMQWLALHLRFVEPLSTEVDSGALVGWKEFSKVGEVVDEMRRVGREGYVVEMGIGSAK